MTHTFAAFYLQIFSKSLEYKICTCMTISSNLFNNYFALIYTKLRVRFSRIHKLLEEEPVF